MGMMNWAAALAIALTPLAGQAATVSNEASLPLALNSPTALTLTKFDSTLGTLTGAVIEVAGSVSGRLTFQSTVCPAGTTGTCTFTRRGNLSLAATSSIIGFSAQASILEVIGCTATTGSTCVGERNASVSLQESKTVTDSNLDDLIGPGQFEILFSWSSTFRLENPRGTQYSAKVTYTYVEPAVVPVPASLPLLLAGVGGLAVLSRRRRVA